MVEDRKKIREINLDSQAKLIRLMLKHHSAAPEVLACGLDGSLFAPCFKRIVDAILQQHRDHDGKHLLTEETFIAILKRDKLGADEQINWISRYRKCRYITFAELDDLPRLVQDVREGHMALVLADALDRSTSMINDGGYISGAAALVHRLQTGLDAVSADGPGWVPFPVECLPDLPREFVLAAAKSVDADPAGLALHLLAGAASAVGYSHIVHVKDGFTQPCILWTAHVSESGNRKSQIFRHVMDFIQPREGLMQRANFQSAQAYKNSLRNWKRSRDGTVCPQPDPEQHLIIDDTTYQAIAPILQDNPHGVLVAAEELAAWIDSFDRYSGSGGQVGTVDANYWNRMYDAGPFKITRRTVEPICVSHALVSVLGSIVPDQLKSSLQNHLENGFAARLVVVMPPREPQRLTGDVVDHDLISRMTSMFDGLYELRDSMPPMRETWDDDVVCDIEPSPDPAIGQQVEPIRVQLSLEASQIYQAWCDRWSLKHYRDVGFIAAVNSKTTGRAARLALLLHLMSQVTEDRQDEAIQPEIMLSAIHLAEWFANEWLRVWKSLITSPTRPRAAGTIEDLDDDDHVLKLVSRHQTITPKILCQYSRRFKTAREAREALQRCCGYGTLHKIGTDPHDSYIVTSKMP